MPNNIDVKEMLMSAYFDTDREKNFHEFYDLAIDIYNGEADGKACAMYYKGQAISQLARAFAERGETEEAQKWARKSIPVFNSMEIIETMIDKGEELFQDVAFCTYWFLEELYFFTCRLDHDVSAELRDDYKQSCFLTVAQIYEAVYKNDDAGFEQLQHLCNLHQGIAEYEANRHGDEGVVKYHLERAFECSKKSMTVKEHKLSHPMLCGLQVYNAPSDNRINVRCFSEHLKQAVYEPFRKTPWFSELESNTVDLLK